MRVFLAALAVLAAPGVGRADATTQNPPFEAKALAQPAFLGGGSLPTPLAARFSLVSDRLADAAPVASSASATRIPVGLGAERARILLRSLTLPGWGQGTLGRRTSMKTFLLAEGGIWGSFVAFRVQEALRRRSSVTTAKLFAGIDLTGHDEEFRRIVGVYASSDDYNLYVVARDAANIYLGHQDPKDDNIVAYHQYITDHSLKGGDTWAWDGPESFDRYVEERKLTRRAALRANAMLGLAIANRLVSALHAARHAGAATAPAAHSWKLECGPHPSEPGAMAVGMRFQF